LNRRLDPDAYFGVPHEVLFQIVASFDGALKAQGPPGLVSSGPGTEHPSQERLAAPLQVVANDGGTLMDALNELGDRSSLGWFAREYCGGKASECRCQLGLITPTSVAWTSCDAAAGLPFGR
jgi:hypothetical protein